MVGPDVARVRGFENEACSDRHAQTPVAFGGGRRRYSAGWLVRHPPTEVFYRIAYGLLLMISLTLLWQACSEPLAG
jgi:hypothetical protein